MNGAELLVRALVDDGVDIAFGYPGGAILPLYDAMYDGEIRHILARHEQGAIMAADGWSRASGRPGVCIATSGPGATNLITGLANAFMDSVPLLAITGQVPTTLMGTDAFQEVDVLGMTMPIVKHSMLVRDAHDLYWITREALQIARSGRPGPVLLDLPKDVQLTEIDLGEALRRFEMRELRGSRPVRPASADQLTRALDLLQAAERPLVYAGGGVFLGDAIEDFRRFVDTAGLPTVLTLKGLGALPADHPLCMGMLGMHGMQAPNLAVQEADLLVCVGARFDDRVTGRLETFAPNARVVHLDIDPAEVGKRRGPDAPVVGELRASLAALRTELDIGPWRERCGALQAEHVWDYNAPGDDIYAPGMLKELSQAAALRDTETFVACDVGQHQMWVAQHYRFDHPRHHLTSGGLGAMGYGLPAAIGAQLAQPDATVISVNGDGGVQMNIQELATIGRYQLPLKIVILDNSRLGMVRQWQELFLDGRYSETDLSDNPDFVRVAEAFGIPGMRIATREQVPEAIAALLDTPGPLLLHVRIDPMANVWPFVPPGAPNTQMMMEST